MSYKIFFPFGVFLGVFFGVFLQILKKMKRESIITLPQIVHVIFGGFFAKPQKSQTPEKEIIFQIFLNLSNHHLHLSLWQLSQ